MFTSPFDGLEQLDPTAMQSTVEIPDEMTQGKVLKAVNNLWTSAMQVYAQPRNHASDIVRMYNSDLPNNWGKTDVNGKQIEVGPQSRTQKSWTFQAIRAATAHTMAALFPGDAPFRLASTNLIKAPSLAIIQDVMEALLVQAKTRNRFKHLVAGAYLQGEAALCAYLNLKGLSPKLDLNIVQTADIFTYPATEPQERCVIGARFFMTPFELNRDAEEMGYFNLDKVPANKDTYTSSTSINGANTGNSIPLYRRMGVEIRTLWCPELSTGDEVYENVVCTVLVNGGGSNVLLQFRSYNATPYSCRPYQHFIFNPLAIAGLGLSNIGRSLCHAGYAIELEAITKANLLLDAQKFGVHPMRKWFIGDEARGTTREQFTRAYPGQLVTVGAVPEWHLAPIEINSQATSTIMAEIESLKQDYQQAVGIPNFLSGTQSQDDKRVSATAKRLQASGSDTMLKDYCESFNEDLFYPFFMSVYCQVAEAYNNEVEAFNGHMDPATLPPLGPMLTFASQVSANFAGANNPDGSIIPAPLPVEVTLELKGYDSELDQVDRLNQAQSGLEALMQIAQMAPMLLPMFDVAKLLEVMFRNMGLGYAIIPPALRIAPEMLPTGEEAPAGDKQEAPTEPADDQGAEY